MGYGMDSNIFKNLLVDHVGTINIYSVFSVKNNYKLEKYNKRYKDVFIRCISDVKDNIELDENYLQALPIYDEILDFISVVFKDRNSIETINFYRNISCIQVMFRKKNLLDLIFGMYDIGNYYPIYNEMVITKSKSVNTSKHELFHVASTYVDKNKNIFSGFSQSVGCLYFIGNAIDEGYTELLTKRYFGEEDGDKFYFFETLAMSLVEKIVGRTKMERLYFQSNLRELILELCKYSSYEDTLKFISNMDLYNDINASKFGLFFYKDLLLNCLNEIACYLFGSFCVKLLIENGSIDLNFVKNFGDILKEEIYLDRKDEKNKVYYFSSADELRIIDEVKNNYVFKKKSRQLRSVLDE